MQLRPILNFGSIAIAALGISFGVIPPVSLASSTTPLFIAFPPVQPWEQPFEPKVKQCRVVEDGRLVALDDSASFGALARRSPEEIRDGLAATELKSKNESESAPFESHCREKVLTADQIYGLLTGHYWREKEPPECLFSPISYDPSGHIRFNANRFEYRSNSVQNSGSWGFVKTSKGGGYLITSDAVQRIAFLDDGSLSLAGHIFETYGAPLAHAEKRPHHIEPHPRQLAAIDILTSGQWCGANDFVTEKNLQFLADGQLNTTSKDNLSRRRFWSFLPGSQGPTAHGYASANAHCFARAPSLSTSFRVFNDRLIVVNGCTFVSEGSVKDGAALNQGLIVAQSSNMNLLVTYDLPIVDGRPTVLHMDVTNLTARSYGLLNLWIERCRLQFDPVIDDYVAVDKLLEGSYGRSRLIFPPGKTTRMEIPVMLNRRHPAQIVFNLQSTAIGAGGRFALFYGDGLHGRPQQ